MPRVLWFPLSLAGADVTKGKPKKLASRVCRKRLVARIKTLPPQATVPAASAAVQLILGRCPKCGGCWMARL